MLRLTLLGLFVVFVAPLATHAVWWQLRPHARSWAEADWTSAGILPPAERQPGAVLHVMAGRTGRWKGIFAHHTWIVIKPPHSRHYVRYEVVGWGRPLRVDAYAPDGRWYGDTPRVLLTLTGPAAERAIPRVLSAIAAYPFADRGSYGVWPGPNSNTFIAAIARAVPEIAPALLPTAIGKDYARWPGQVGRSISGTGVELSLAGILGVTVGWIEGVEINLLGLVAGLDIRRPAIKVPGWGRIGLSATAM